MLDIYIYIYIHTCMAYFICPPSYEGLTSRAGYFWARGAGCSSACGTRPFPHNEGVSQTPLCTNPGTDLKDDQMQHVLNSLSRLTRKLTQQLGEFVGSTIVTIVSSVAESIDRLGLWTQLEEEGLAAYPFRLRRLHLAEQELKDEMRCALKAQKEVQDHVMLLMHMPVRLDSPRLPQNSVLCGYL